MQDLETPIMRLVFNAIAGQKSPNKIKHAMGSIAINIERATKDAFHKWKLWLLGLKKDIERKKAVNASEAGAKMDRLVRSRPRMAVRSVNKNM